MRVDLFDFDLPRGRIAQHPAVPRDSARLLCVTADGLQDLLVRDLPGVLRAGDRLVVNDTRVIPARLTGFRGAARIDATLVRPLEGGLWQAFARPAKRLAVGHVVTFGAGFEARVAALGERGAVTLDFGLEGADFDAALRRHGTAPLPPYIKRAAGPERRDESDYQTMFARQPGAVAAPTAGLHFTSDLMARLADAGIDVAAITLHIGAGTFRPVHAADTQNHRLHSEWGEIDADAAAEINAARAAGGRIVAVGTTAARLLESAAAEDGAVRPFAGETDLFITPGYRFRACDLLLTNFHLPRSSLFMLVCAFSGLERMHEAYAHAVTGGYRFYSYGDACLLAPAGS